MAGRILCPICNNNVKNHMFQIKCCLCSKNIHKKCTMLNETEFDKLSQSQIDHWSCRICNESVFAFNDTDDDDLFQRSIFELNLDNPSLSIIQGHNLILEPFDLNDDSDDIPLSDIDPDLQFYNNIHHNLYNKCDYFDECDFNRAITKKFDDKQTFALFHLNIRSLPANLTHMLCYMANLKQNFDIIGVTENWLTPENKDLYYIQNYEHINNIRTSRAGGGVSLFISSNIKYKELTEFYISNDNLECLFVEAEIDSAKEIIGIVYRPPNSNVDTFTSLLNDILDKLKMNNKHCWIMGDFNIDLMKNNSHKPTTDFINMMFANALIPLINKPTRITSTTATIIDNIFSNKYSAYENIMQGNLTTDISDHFAQFHISEINKSYDQQDECILIRLKNQTNSERYINSINNFNWSCIQELTECNQAYRHFTESLKNIYNESFPVKKVKKRYRNRLPWLTEGLRKSIKHKNKLYKKYIKYQTSYNRRTYTTYNNKLKSILKKTEKEHYQIQLVKCKDNLKKTWSIIKDVINKSKCMKNNDTFKYNNSTTTDKSLIANKFNDYFINIGNKLAASIPQGGPNFQTFLPPANEDTIFITPTNSDEVKRILSNLKNSAPGHDELTLNDIKKCIRFFNRTTNTHY